MPAKDILIVGGGIIGCALGFRLAQEKLRVTVLDRSEPGQEASWAAAGMLAPTSEHHAVGALAELCRASARLYPEWLSRLGVGEVGYREEGTLQIAFSEEEARALDRLPGERLPAEELRWREPALSERALAGVYLPDDRQVDNRRLLAALVEACRRRGVRFEAGPEVRCVRVEGGRATGVRLADGSERAAGTVVNAAGCWAGSLGEPASRYAPVRPVRGQMMTLAAEAALLRHVVRSARGYLVPRSDGRILLGSTMEDAGYDKSLTPAGLQGILAAAMEIAPAVASLPFAGAWAGLRPDTPDHRPILGATGIENYFVATGHFRNGVLLAPITAELLADVILGRPPVLPLEPFSPLRFVRQGTSPCPT